MTQEAMAQQIAEDVPEIVASKGRDALSAMEMVALLTKVVQVQEKEIAELKKMKEKVSMMETILSNLALKASDKDKDQLSVNLK